MRFDRHARLKILQGNCYPGTTRKQETREGGGIRSRKTRGMSKRMDAKD